MPKGVEAEVIRKQLLRSGTSVGAQYREACRARSKAEFCSKVNAALQELDETAYWIELLIKGGLIRKEKLSQLQEEVDELTAIFVTSLKTAQRR